MRCRDLLICKSLILLKFSSLFYNVRHIHTIKYDNNIFDVAYKFLLPEEF